MKHCQGLLAGKRRRTIVFPQRGWTTPHCAPVWVAVIVHRGNVEHIGLYGSESKAEQGVVDHINRRHEYDGPANFDDVMAWIETATERFTVQITDFQLQYQVAMRHMSEHVAGYAS